MSFNPVPSVKLSSAAFQESSSLFCFAQDDIGLFVFVKSTVLTYVCTKYYMSACVSSCRSDLCSKRHDHNSAENTR